MTMPNYRLNWGQSWLYLADDGVVTGGAVALGNDGDALLAHVGVKVAKHGVQVVAAAALVAWQHKSIY